MNKEDELYMDQLGKTIKSVDNYFNPEYKFALCDRVQDDKTFLPVKSEPKATGFDVRAAINPDSPLVIAPLDYVKIPLGFRGFCPPGWWYELKPRSSTFGKKNLNCLYGTIDETYEGELVLAVQYIPSVGLNAINGPKSWQDYINSNHLTIKYGEAVGQIVPVKRQEMSVTEVSNEEYDRLCAERQGIRGAGGFGSSDTGFIKYGQ